MANRSDEARDAARNVMKCEGGVAGVGVDLVLEFGEVARLGWMEGGFKGFYEKVKLAEKSQQSKADEESSPRDKAVEDAKDLLDMVAFDGADWRSCRSDLAKIYEEAGMNAFADFVKP